MECFAVQSSFTTAGFLAAQQFGPLVSPSFALVSLCFNFNQFQTMPRVVLFAVLFALAEGWKWMAKIKAPSFSRMQTLGGRALSGLCPEEWDVRVNCKPMDSTGFGSCFQYLFSPELYTCSER